MTTTSTSSTATVKPEFTISKDRNTLLKDGQPFYTSPIANDCMGSINVGCVVPQDFLEKKPSGLSFYQAGWAHGTVLIGTGSCCEGFAVAICDHGEGSGKISAIQGIDFNIYHINPIVFTTKGHEDKEYDNLGFLVTGAGCSGKGVRFVHFKALPTVIPIVPSDENLFSHETWFTLDPLTRISDIWERLEKHGIKVDRERTLAAQKEFTFFNTNPHN
jgi:hypothetical protein